MDNHFEHCTAHVTSLEQDGFLIKIHAQVPSDSGVSGRELLSRVDQISGHLRRVKCCDRISRGQLAFARIEDNFHRVRALGDDVEGRVAVRFIDYGREDVLLLSDIIIVDPPLSDVLTTIRPLAEDFYLDGILLMRPLSNEEIVVLSEKILYRTVSCRLRRLHPELSLIELASTNAAGDRPELFSNIVIELGFGNKCTSEDIANYLRIKIPARSEESAMQPARGFGGSPFSVPPPNILGSQPTTILGPHSSNMLGQQHTTVHGSQPAILMSSQPTQSHPSVNSRLSKFKKDAALNMGPGVNLYNQTNSPPPQLADRKQYTVTDGRTCTTAPTLPVKSTHNAYISHVEDGPFSFTIQLKSSVEELLPKLRNILVRYQNSPITAQLIPGSVVMAKSSDETLKRGVIMNVQPETCKVYYIDYGNFEELPYTDIFQLPNTAAELSPAMAMQFCLADLKSMKITDSNKDYFARLLLGKQILIRVTERESNSPFQYCEILWEGRNVREILLNLNSPMQYSYQYPPRGREAPVSVIYVDGPSQFFVQYRSELNVANQIQEALATYCPSQPRVSDLSAINIGSPVASIFPDDQRWYRALVMGMDNCNINVFYVDYGNRAEVNPNQICLLSRDLVNKWKTQAIECCLIGFDTVTPDLFMAEKMEDATLGHSYTLRLHSILSGFRLSVDLLDDQGNSIATKMKNLLNERQKSINHPLPSTEKNKPQASHDEDRASQHSSDSGGKMNKFQRPGTRGDKVGNKPDQHGDKKFDNRNKFEARPNSYSQHDDRSGNDYKPRNDTRSDWKKGAKKPYMDQENEWGDNSNQEPKPYAKKESWGEKQNSGGAFKKQEWATDDKPARGGDRGSRPDRGERQGGGFRSDGDRQSGNKFERKPYNINDDARSGNRGPRDHKFGDRDNKFGDRDNKFGDRENKFGDRDNRFADRDSRYGRDNNRENNRFGGRDNKFGDKSNNRDERKPKWNEPGAVKSTVADQGDSWDDAGVQPSVKRPSVVISEYPHQEIKIGQDYKVLFAGMETSPRDIYVQLSDCDSELDKIRSIIDADATATSRPISKAVLAMPVLARFQDDGLLYRATIRSITKVPSGRVDVLFVDFGNTAVNALSEVFTISSELMSIPIQAIHVIVSDMPTTPFPNLSACQAHFETDYLTLKPSRTTTINLEQVIEGKVIHPDGNSVADLIKNDPSCLREPQAIVESLRVEQTSVDVIENDPPGLGETQAVVESQEVEQAPVVLWRERLDFLLGQQLRGKVVKKLEGNNTYSIKITAVLDLIVPAQSVHQLSSGLNQGDDIIVSVEGLTEDKLLVKYYNRRGQSFGDEAAISWIIPMQIVERKGVYTMSHRESATIYLQRDNTATMTDLIDRLFEKYEGSTPDVYEFKVGDICVAKSFDGNWYRAKISAAVENNFTVHYIDYGNKEEIKVENLRKLDDEFNSPAMCVGVVLPVAIKDVDVCLEGVGDGPFDCTFIKRDIEKGVWIVDLETLSELGENKKNLALKFIDEGKAEPNLYSDISADPVRRGPSWNLKKGERVPIVISHVDAPDKFFAHHLKHSRAVDKLQREIQDLPDEGGDLDKIFLAKYTEDSMWYRAVGVGECVSFLDYGNQDPSKEKKKLPAKFIHPVEGYAMPLRLCVRASGEEWTEESAQIFDSFIECDLEAEIISVDFDSIVDLRAKDDSLSKIYVDGGHAVRFDTPLMNHNLFDDILEDELPSGKVPASVTAITSVNDFYIQENSKMDVLDLLASKLEAAESFEVIEKPSLGQNLIAKFVEDSIWYRAKVIHQESSETEVLFLDYGNVSPATEFRVLPIELSAFPFLSWHCSLNMEDTPAINNHFKSLVDDGTVFDISFREKKGNVWVVQLTVNNVSPFDSTTIPENRNVEIPAATAENIVEVQARPILPALGKPLYKDCVLCHSNGPYDFYVQTDDDHIQIEEMANSLFEAGTFPKIDAVKKGDFVVAQFSEDDAYYRAVVTDVEPEVVVHFIDYGNSCPASCFHELPTPLKAIPQLAIRCSLQSPIGGWSVDAIDKFTSLLNSDTKAIDLKIISKGDPSIVDVEINGASITKQLAPDAKFETESIQESLPVNDEETILPSSGVCYIASVTSKECYIHDSSVSADLDVITEQLASIDVSDVNCEIKDAKVGDLVGACHEDALYRACVTKLDPQEVYFIDYGNSSPVAKFFKLPQSIKNKKPLAIKVKLDLGEGMELNDDGLMELQSLAVDGVNYTQTKPSVVELKVGVDKVTDLLKSHLVVADSIGDASESKSVPPSTSGEAVPITISHVNSPSDFYYQVDSSKVNEMSSRLTEAEQFSTIDKCDVGQVICAKFSEDELWYRARVLTTEPSVTVFFLDYGNTYEVKEMKQLPDDLSKIPPLCVKASLEHQDIEWTEEEIDKFSEIAFGNPSLTSSIIENGADVVHVRLDSSEVGDVLTHLGRSCSIETPDSEYGTPECLSVEDIVPPEHCDESTIQNSLSSSPIDLPVASLMSLAPENHLIEQFTDNNCGLSVDLVERSIENVNISKCIPTTSVDHLDNDKEILVHVASDTSIENRNDLGSSDILTQLAKTRQATPPKNGNELYCEPANHENYGFLKEEEVIEACAQSIESESRVPENNENFAETFSLELVREKEPLAECQHVETSADNSTMATKEVGLADELNQCIDNPQLNSSSNSLMALAQATLPLFLGEIDANSESPAIVGLKADIDCENVMTNVSTDALNVLPTILEESKLPGANEVQNVPESGSYFRLLSLKETLYAALGYERPDHEVIMTNTSGSSDIIQSNLKTNEESNQCDMTNSSMTTHASTTLNETFDDESYFGDLPVENISSLASALVGSAEEITKNFLEEDGLINKGQTDIQSSISESQHSFVKTGSDICGTIDTTAAPINSTLDAVVELQTSEELPVDDFKANLSSNTDETVISVSSIEDIEEHHGLAADLEYQEHTNANLPDTQVNLDVTQDSSHLDESKVLCEVITDTTSEHLSTAASIVDDMVELVQELLTDEIKAPPNILGQFQSTKTELIVSDPEAQKQTTIPVDLYDAQVNREVFENSINEDESQVNIIINSGMTVEQFFKFTTAAASTSTTDELIADHDISQELHSDEITAPPLVVDESEERRSDLNVTDSNPNPQDQTPLNLELSDSYDNPVGTVSMSHASASNIVEELGKPTDDLTEPGVTIPKIDGKNLVDTQEDSKTELNVTDGTVALPMDSSTIGSRAECVDMSTVSEEKEITSAKFVSKPSSITTGPSKKPVKTLAQIKASAKARISTGRHLTSKPRSKLPSPTNSTKLPTSSRCPGERDRMIPGTVNGRLV